MKRIRIAAAVAWDVAVAGAIALVVLMLGGLFDDENRSDPR